MSKDRKIPVHRRDRQLPAVYVAPLGADKSALRDYEAGRPHRHDFYYCVLLEEGSLELEVDFEKVTVNSGDLYLSYPGQVHRVESVKAKQGWYIAFDPSVPDEPVRDMLDQFLSETILVPLSGTQLTGLSGLVAHLHTIAADSRQLFREKVIQGLVSAFIYEAAAAYLSVERTELMRHSVRAVEITKQFKQLLRRNFRSMKKPSAFAAAMNLTLSHLNDTVRSVTGFPVTYWIQHQLIREAQRLLSRPGMTVKETAGTLGFEDEKYFNRLFSRVTGTSPGLFRKRLEHLYLCD